ncbi:MAG: glycosyltransferase family 39 protein [Thermoleophilia bacterium]|nr:glycosyltransferase family 39 protein [Thermoleophilia bacterium]
MSENGLRDTKDEGYGGPPHPGRRDGPDPGVALDVLARETAVPRPGNGSEHSPAGRKGSGRRAVFWLWAVLLAQGVFFALIQPVWSRVDEAQHFHFVQFIVEDQALPVAGRTFISPEVMEVSLARNQWSWRPAGMLSTPAYLDPDSWITVPPELDERESEKWIRRNLWRFNYEAMQPPLYYMVNAPVYAALPDNSFVRLYGMRLLAALMASAMVPVAYLMAREAFPDSRLVVYGTPAVVLMTQGYALNMSQVTNDALAIPLAAASILVLLRMVSRGLSWKRSLLAGGLAGASMLAKLTAVFLLPLALLAPAVLLAYHREKLKRVLVHAGVMMVVPASLLAPWLVRNLAVYGDPTGSNAAQPLMSSFFRTPTSSLETLRMEELFPTYWFGEPVYSFGFWAPAGIGIGLAMALAVAGLLHYFFGRDHRQVPDVHICVTFLAFALLIGVAVNLVIPFMSGIGGVPGRYLYPLMPVIAFLLVFGIDRLLRRERARFVVETLLVWIIVWESINVLSYVKNL